MSKPKKQWTQVQIKAELHRHIRKLAFPEPEIEIRVLTSALLEHALSNEEIVKRICNELRGTAK